MDTLLTILSLLTICGGCVLLGMRLERRFGGGRDGRQPSHHR